ncbi:hypothetical protein BGZ65_006404, partial [Modicella reniformis]
YPLFVDVEIKMHCDLNNHPKDRPTEVLIAFQNVVNRHSAGEEEKPYVHRVIIHEEARRRQSQDLSTAFASFK